jgi:hypothetical protein
MQRSGDGQPAAAVVFTSIGSFNGEPTGRSTYQKEDTVQSLPAIRKGKVKCWMGQRREVDAWSSRGENRRAVDITLNVQ